MELYVLIGVLGIITGIISGMLGIGGGIIMAPLLLYVPPLFGFFPMSMQAVAGLTIVQGLCACIAGGLTHKKYPYFSRSLVAWMGGCFFISSFAGGVASADVKNELLLIIFAGMAFAAAIIILLPNESGGERPELAQFTFSRFRSLIVSGGIGLLGGLVGQGGSFILIPLMTTYMKVPIRIAISSNLAIVFLATFAAFLGKAVTCQIEWLLAAPIVLTVIPGAHLGAKMSQKVSVDDLRKILAACIGLAALKIGMSVAGF